MSRLRFSAVAVGALLLSATMMNAQIVAYDTPVQPGNQAFTGNLGLDFDVNSAILVTSLGVFDSNVDGVTGPITVAIFNRDTMTQVGGSCTFSNALDAGTTSINSNRFCTSPAQAFVAFPLPIGHYSVVAVGFGINDLNGNSTLPGFFPSAENTGGGLITFVGTGRYDGNTTLDFPTTVPPGTPSNVFNAGTFQFTAPQPPTISKAFGTTMLISGETTSLRFSLKNPNTIPLTNVSFTDTLPDGLVVATPHGLTGSCGGGAISAVPGSSTISLSGATLPGGGSCTFKVNVTGVSTGVEQQTLTNTTSAPTSTESGPGVPATASISEVDFLYFYWFFAA